MAKKASAEFMHRAEPLIRDASAQHGGFLTADDLQGVLNEALERDHMQALHPVGNARTECKEYLADTADELHVAGADGGYFAFGHDFAELDPDTDLSPIAVMGVTAENLDRLLQNGAGTVEDDVRDGVAEDAVFVPAFGPDADALNVYQQVRTAAFEGRCLASVMQLITRHGGLLVLQALVALLTETAALSIAEAAYNDSTGRTDVFGFLSAALV